LLTSPVVQSENLQFSEKGVDEVAKKNLGRLGNVLAFWKLYDDGTPRDWTSTNVLDRWILARLDQLIREATDGFEKYQLDSAARPIAGFIDDLSVWYLRRSRDRFKEDTPDKKAALATIRYVLHRLSLVMAPTMPFFAEHVFQAIRESEDEESVHLALWPEPKATVSFFARLLGRGSKDGQLLAAMKVAREIVTQALEAREKAGIKVRQPLALLTIPTDTKLAPEYLAIVADEVNVKNVVTGPASVTNVSLDTTITPLLEEEGRLRELMRTIQQFRKETGMKPGEPGVYTVSEDSRPLAEKYREQIEKSTHTTLRLN
jgi:isoleucyl-tRNA synthetase